jgi:hypothetical protein
MKIIIPEIVLNIFFRNTTTVDDREILLADPSADKISKFCNQSVKRSIGALLQ